MYKLSQNNNVRYSECARCESKAGAIAISINLALALFKFIIGMLSGSKAILADSLYSLKDFFVALVVFVGVKISSRPADSNHPYGHEKVDFVAIFIISLAILVGTVFVLLHSVKDLWTTYTSTFNPPKFIAFWAALISLVANYQLYRYLHCLGTKLKSPAILASAKHNHSDAMSSVTVAIAMLGTKFGFAFLDPIVAVIETIDLIRLNVVMLKDSINGMMDRAVSEDLIKKIESIIVLVPGVKKVKQIVGRRMGHGVWFDVVIMVDHNLPYENGYLISKQVEASLRNRVDNIANIDIRIKPYTP